MKLATMSDWLLQYTPIPKPSGFTDEVAPMIEGTWAGWMTSGPESELVKQADDDHVWSLIRRGARLTLHAGRISGARSYVVTRESHGGDKTPFLYWDPAWTQEAQLKNHPRVVLH